jgi:antitoxin MazE
MKARIQKWGDSLAVRIPKAMADEASLAEDSLVDLTVGRTKLAVVPITHDDPSLEELVARITPENRHAETKTGGIVGNEVW